MSNANSKKVGVRGGSKSTKTAASDKGGKAVGLITGRSDASQARLLSILGDAIDVDAVRSTANRGNVGTLDTTKCGTAVSLTTSEIDDNSFDCVSVTSNDSWFSCRTSFSGISLNTPPVPHVQTNSNADLNGPRNNGGYDLFNPNCMVKNTPGLTRFGPGVSFAFKVNPTLVTEAGVNELFGQDLSERISFATGIEFDFNSPNAKFL